MSNRMAPIFLKKIYLSRREIKMILDAVDDSAENLDKSWKEEMVSKLKRAIRRSKKKESKAVKKDENKTQIEL